MRNKIFTICLLFIISSIQLFGQTSELTQEAKARQYLDRKGEVYFLFQVQSRSELDILTWDLSIDKVSNNQVWAYANRKEFDKFLLKGYQYEVLSHPGDVEVEMYDPSKGIWQFDTYPTYTEFETMMNTFASTYPNLCKIVQIGTTVDGRKLLFAVISDNVNTAEAEARFMYTSSMHGDETTGYVTMLRLINYLLSNYASSAEVQNLVNNLEIWIMPLENPDGTYAGGNNTVTGATRGNGNNVDINRNFKNPVGGAHPDGEVYQPETIAMMAFLDTMHFVGSANFHGGAEVVNYPFDSWTSTGKTHADDAWWQFVSREFADTVHVYSPSTYLDDLNNGITNGGDWYVVYGSRQDYETYYCLGREFCLEVSNTKLPTASTLPTYWNYLNRSLLNYMQQALFGFKGTITDACTGLPIKAKVFVNTHDRDSSHVYSNLPFGNYYRPIKAGTWSVTWSATGYQSVTQNVTCTDLNVVTVNKALTPLAPVAGFAADITSGCNSTITFTNQSQAPAGSTFLWNFGDGQTSNLENPVHTYAASGSYTVTLTVTNSCTGNDQEIKTNYITITLPTAPTTTPAARCGTGTVSLGASGSGTLNWYDAASGGNLVNTGTSFTTPSLSSTTTYYVESSTSSYGASQYAGKADNSGTGQYFTSTSSYRYMTFDAIQDLKLVSVKVYAQNAGNRTFELRNSSGVVINSATVNVPVSGTSGYVVTLNFDIPAGGDYQLGVATGTYNNLYISANQTYPFTLTGVIDITGNSQSNTYYYFFYNWEVQTLTTCNSGRTSVVATINPAPSANAGSDQSVCQGTLVNLTASGGGTYAWSHSLGNTANVSVTPTATTTYTVTVTNAQSCTATDQVTVTVNSIPTANAGTDKTICSGTSTSLTATGGGTYAWSHSLGTTATVSASPSTTTTYTVTVTSAPGCTDTDDIVVTVNTSPTANAGADDATCNGTPVSLTATGGGTYNWSGGLGTTATVTANPASTTTYTVTVTAANSCTDTDDITVTVYSVPTINAGTDQSIPNNTSTTINATAGGGSGSYAYSWSPAGLLVNATIQDPTTINLTSSITFTVTITDNSSGCTATDQVNIDVVGGVLSVTATATPGAICQGSSTQLEAFASGGVGAYTYTWASNPAGFTSSIANPVVNPTGNTTYAVTVTDGVGSTYSNISVTVNSLPTANAGSDVGVCLNASVNLNASGGSSYEWSTSETSQMISVSPTVNQTYTVTVTNAAGCTDTDDVTVTVYTLPIASAGSNTSVCEGNSVSLNANGGTTYEWSNGAGSTASVSVSPTATTTYIVTVTDTHGCTDTDDVMVTVNSLPVAGFSFVQNELNVVYSNTSSGATSYFWYFGDGGISSQANPNYNYINEGTYNVTLISTNGCGSDTIIQSVDVYISSIAGVANNQIRIYPNPAKDILNIEMEGFANSTIRIFSVDGKLISETKAEMSNTICVSDLSEGLYYIIISSETGQIISRTPVAIGKQ